MRIFPFAAIVTASALIAGCTRQVEPHFETTAIDTLLTDGVNSYQVEYRFTSITNAAKSPALEDIERSNIGYFFELEEFTGTLSEAIETSLHELSAEIRTPATAPRDWAPQTYEISAESEAKVVDTLLVYAITRYNFTGGAHGIYGTDFHLYSLATGMELRLADLLSDRQIEGLNGLIREKLYKQYEVKDDKGLEAAGFFPDDIAASENFDIAEDGTITFFYNPYEIGCYALGGVEVSISGEELKNL